ncbi:MAG: fused MFS/spermidine synthase [Roseiflexaceae bacterium]
MAEPTHSQRPVRALPLVVFLAGVGTLGVEMIASRLLAPYFGTSQPIWAAVIGLTLLYLAIGYHIGGRLADRRPEPQLLAQILLVAGVATSLIPLLARPILSGAQQALVGIEIGAFLGALLGTLLLFAIPVTLLAMVSPLAVRLRLLNSTEAGSTVGTLSALSTLGSIVGTFLTVLVFIPSIGTTRTTLLYAGLLVLLGFIGWRTRWAAILLILFGIIASATFALQGNVKAAGCAGCTLITEQESASNYIQVAERSGPNGQQTVLMLNEGLAVHSIYNQRYQQSGNPSDLLSGGGPWDYFVIAPFLYPNRTPESIQSMAMLGSGAGTAPALFYAIYGPERRVDAVEIDGAIIDLSRRYFGANDAESNAPNAIPTYRVYAEDARYWLATSNQRYDIIAIDAYHQPYIPFHLTTQEFFARVRSRLNDQGVAVINAGLGPNGDDRLGQAIIATMRTVFPEVYIMETARGGNQIIIGVNQAVGDGWGNMIANYEVLTDPTLRAIVEQVQVSERPINPHVAPFTDDHAPVEALVDSLIFDVAVTPP